MAMALGVWAASLTVAAGSTTFDLGSAGTEDVIDYGRYGYFREAGTRDYEYVVTNNSGLAAACGVGVDPNNVVTGLPGYVKAKAKGRITKDWWSHVATTNAELDFYIWATSEEEPGTRQLFTGKALENGGHYLQALKAYQATIVLYPASGCWSASAEWEWSVADGAWHSIKSLLRRHPEIGLDYTDADVIPMTEETGLKVAVKPGRFGKVDPATLYGKQADLDDLKVVETRGKGKVQFVKFENGHWGMRVDGKPFMIHGMNYSPTKTGKVPWEWAWMLADENTNGVNDLLETWVDRNGNHARDEDEPVVGDARLLKQMNCNAIKVYSSNVVSSVLRQMHEEGGTYVILGDFLGAYCINSGATWEEGTDYTNPEQRARMKEAVRNMVLQYKDEPWLLLWVLGNENNMPSTDLVNTTRTNASREPEAYATFLNEVAAMIHEIDPDHPVGVGNLMTGLVEYYGKHAPELDFIGVNVYIGGDGFGATWQKVKQTMDRPVMIAEYGCDNYWTGRGPDDEGQVGYYRGCLDDINYNRAGYPGCGNSIGGCAFEFLDEWWKDTRNYFEDPTDHQSVEATGDMAFPDGKSQEEWFGVMGQGDGKTSPFLRVPKKSFWFYKEAWESEDKGGKEGG
jgi:beta-glucuronidase